MRVLHWSATAALGMGMVGCGSVEDSTEPVGIEQAKLDAAACSPKSPGIPIAPGVVYYDCHDSDPAVHIVTVDRSLPATEIQLIADRRSSDLPGLVRLKRVTDLATGVDAIAAINGFTWSGLFTGLRGHGGLPAMPTSTTFLFDNQLTRNTLGDNGSPANESLMGFARGGPRGIQARRIRHPPDSDAEFDLPENLPYRYQMYGSSTSVMIDGVCQRTGTESSRWSVVGYSPTSVVFLSTASNKEYLHQQFCPTLYAFGVTDAVRNDGSTAAGLYVGGGIDKLANPLTGLDQLLFGDSRNIAYAVGIVPRAAQTSCTRIVDSAGAAFAALCITPENSGYLAELFILDGSGGRCGTFQFKLDAEDGVAFEEPFDVCSGDKHFARSFDVGTLGGCATLHLLELSGADFGFKEWTMPACGDPGGPVPGPDPGPGPGADTTPPSTVLMPSVSANADGWNNSDVTVQFSATDTGAAAPVASVLTSGIRAIHVSLRGAQTDNIVIPGASGSVTITAEGTTHITYFAIDSAGNAEAAKTLTIRIDKTPPQISGMPGPDCSLWPPNHKLVEVATISAADARSGMTAFDVAVTSSEPVGKDGPDVVISGDGLQPRVVELRAKRLGGGEGRLYSITATATDVAGNTVNTTATCTVAHDQGH